MAGQKHKSQAEQAASAAKSKKTNRTVNGKKMPKDKIRASAAVKKEHGIPVRVISSAIFLGLFILFLVIFLKPEGALIKLIEGVIHGLIGRVGFVVAAVEDQITAAKRGSNRHQRHPQRVNRAPGKFRPKAHPHVGCDHVLHRCRAVALEYDLRRKPGLAAIAVTNMPQLPGAHQRDEALIRSLIK